MTSFGFAKLLRDSRDGVCIASLSTFDISAVERCFFWTVDDGIVFLRNDEK